MTQISTDEAEALIDDGVPYVDVRTVEEYDDGHIPNAVNIPFLHNAPSGRVPNPDFLKVMEANFDKSQKFIVGCKAGGRSANALRMLAAAGYTNVLDMTAGFDGRKGTFGETIPGWSAEGREVSQEAEPESTYRELKKRAGV